MSKRASARWAGGLRFAADSTEADSGVTLGGLAEETGARPMSLLLTALASCTAMDVMVILGKKRQTVAGYEVIAEGAQADGQPRVYVSITVEHRFTGGALDDVAVARAVELSATRYCPVTAHLAQGELAIEHRYRIDDDRGERAGLVVVTGPRGAGLIRD